MDWKSFLRKIIVLAICVIVVYILWYVYNKDTKDFNWTFEQAVQYDIDNEKGGETERAIEKMMAVVIGWMPFRLFISIVFGLMIDSIIELIFPSDKISQVAKSIVGFLFDFTSVGPIIGIIVAIGVWLPLYTILGIPILLIDFIVSIFSRNSSFEY